MKEVPEQYLPIWGKISHGRELRVPKIGLSELQKGIKSIKINLFINKK